MYRSWNLRMQATEGTIPTTNPALLCIYSAPKIATGILQPVASWRIHSGMHPFTPLNAE